MLVGLLNIMLGYEKTSFVDINKGNNQMQNTPLDLLQED